jgi:exosome complex component RRP4
MTEERQLVVPGEVIAKGDDFLPGENTKKENGQVIALRYGLSEVSENIAKVIPVSGVYQARRGNVVIGEVVGLTSAGWLVDIGVAENAFLSIMEVPRYVDKNALHEVMDIGDAVIAKIWNMGSRGIDLSVKMRGFGKLNDGVIFEVNCNKIPRIIGKEGSMINLIKDATGCNISVGQNGLIWIKGETIDSELFARKAIKYVEENATKEGLTDAVIKWLEENKK